MARYISIKPQGDVIDEGLVKGRIRLRCNFLVEKAYSETFLKEIVNRLEAESVGTFGTTIFGSSAADLPEGAGPFLTLRQSGGLEPDGVQNSYDVPAYLKPALQVTVVASTYEAANTMMCAAYSALVGVRNMSLSGA